jgi:putative transcriptional regulator
MNLQGKYLVARPVINDPWFKHSIVYIYEYGPQGAAGLIINKPGTMQISRMVNNVTGIHPVYDDLLYNGGPVNENALIMMHTSEWFSTNTHQVTKEISISSDKFMLEKVITGNTPKGFRVCTGMSGWHQGQIENEIKRNHWLVTKLDLSTVFDYSGEDQWQQAVEKVAKTTIDKYLV